MTEARNYKFGVQIDYSEYYPKKSKIRGHKGCEVGSRDLLLNFGTHCISQERLKTETSNLACRETMMSTIQKMKN